MLDFYFKNWPLAAVLQRHLCYRGKRSFFGMYLSVLNKFAMNNIRIVAAAAT